jgi:hypothetical protein
MPVLHMETTKTRGFANQLNQSAQLLDSELRRLSQTHSMLSQNWSGASQQQFMSEAQTALQRLSQLGGFCPTPQKGPIQIFRADFGLLELLRASEAKTLV